MGQKKAPRLPAIAKLRVANPKQKVENPCITTMSSVLACWASAGFNTQGCVALENALRTCMDAPKGPRAPTVTINYHLSRMYDRVIPGSTKKK